MTRIAAILFIVALVCDGARAAERMAIGYVDVQDDPRHKDRLGFGGILLEQRGRAYDGAALAVADLAVVGASVGIDPRSCERTMARVSSSSMPRRRRCWRRRAHAATR